MLAVHNSIPTKPIALPPNLEIVAAEVIRTGYVVCATYFPTNIEIPLTQSRFSHNWPAITASYSLAILISRI